MPVFKIEVDTTAEAWERAVIEVWTNGVRKLTQYTRPKEGGGSVYQESRAATMLVAIRDPLKEPRIHAGDVMGQQAIIAGYIDELVEGTKNHYIGKGWDYTYHDRLFNYIGPSLDKIDQVKDFIVEGLKRGEIFSRRLQAVTWQTWKDIKSESPPCLQRIWVTVPTMDSKPERGKTYKIDLQTCWRSRDLFDAWEANVNGLIELEKRKIIQPLNQAYESKGVRFQVGQYVDFSNDLHIYEKDFDEVRRFLSAMEKKKDLGKRPEEIRRGPPFDELLKLVKKQRLG